MHELLTRSIGEHIEMRIDPAAALPRISADRGQVRELAERIAVVRPDLRVLFMSGYNKGVVGAQHLGKDDWPVVEKPFTADVLLREIRAALMGSARRPG